MEIGLRIIFRLTVDRALLIVDPRHPPQTINMNPSIVVVDDDDSDMTFVEGWIEENIIEIFIQTFGSHSELL